LRIGVVREAEHAHRPPPFVVVRRQLEVHGRNVPK
jgi:hypothetical protein